MHFYIAILLLLISTNSVAQNISHASFDNYALRYNDDEGSKTKFIGSLFLNEDWRRVEVIIQNDTVLYSQARFNMNRNIMEVKVRGEHLYIQGAQISQFRWKGYEEDTSIYRPNVALVKSDTKTKELLQTTRFNKFKLVSSYWVEVRSPSSETPQLGASINEGRIIIQR